MLGDEAPAEHPLLMQGTILVHTNQIRQQRLRKHWDQCTTNTHSLIKVVYLPHLSI